MGEDASVPRDVARGEASGVSDCRARRARRVRRVRRDGFREDDAGAAVFVGRRDRPRRRVFLSNRLHAAEARRGLDRRRARRGRAVREEGRRRSGVLGRAPRPPRRRRVRGHEADVHDGGDFASEDARGRDARGRLARRPGRDPRAEPGRRLSARSAQDVTREAAAGGRAPAEARRHVRDARRGVVSRILTRLPRRLRAREDAPGGDEVPRGDSRRARVRLGRGQPVLPPPSGRGRPRRRRAHLGDATGSEGARPGPVGRRRERVSRGREPGVRGGVVRGLHAADPAESLAAGRERDRLRPDRGAVGSRGRDGGRRRGFDFFTRRRRGFVPDRPPPREPRVRSEARQAPGASPAQRPAPPGTARVFQGPPPGRSQDRRRDERGGDVGDDRGRRRRDRLGAREGTAVGPEEEDGEPGGGVRQQSRREAEGGKGGAGPPGHLLRPVHEAPSDRLHARAPGARAAPRPAHGGGAADQKTLPKRRGVRRRVPRPRARAPEPGSGRRRGRDAPRDRRHRGERGGGGGGRGGVRGGPRWIIRERIRLRPRPRPRPRPPRGVRFRAPDAAGAPPGGVARGLPRGEDARVRRDALVPLPDAHDRGVPELQVPVPGRAEPRGRARRGE